MTRCWATGSPTCSPPASAAVTDYDRFAAFYDHVMDDPAPRAARVVEAIARHRPAAASLLELGCGTGSILAALVGLPVLVGIDRSPEMLARARTKVPRASLVRGDLASFALARSFDVVVCVFDTLNHLLTFDAWLATFDAVADHLAPGGLFVFDVNTVGELRRLGEDPAAVYDFDGGVAIVDVAFADGGRGEAVTQWDVRVFEEMGGCRFRLHHERIGELGVGLSRLRSAVEARFDLLELTDDRGEAAGDDSIKAYFVVRRRAGPGGRRAAPDDRRRAGQGTTGKPAEETTPGAPAGAESASTSTGPEARTR